MTATNNISVSFYRIDAQGNCCADIVLPLSGIKASGFKINPKPDGEIVINKPLWMHDQWSYTEVQWSEVCRVITQEYLSNVSVKEYLPESDTASDKTPLCTFYSSDIKTEASVVVTDVSSGGQIHGIRIMHTNSNDKIQFSMPPKINECCDNIGIEQNYLIEIITNEYGRQILCKTCKSVSDTYNIEFHYIYKSTTCMADIELPNSKKTIKGFEITKPQGKAKPIISTPKWMGRWNDDNISWNNLCSLIINEYGTYVKTQKRHTDSRHAQIDIEDLDEYNTKQVKEKDEFGRIMNAENSSLVFFPRTVLRSIDFPNVNSSVSDLVYALNKGAFGPFEINILEWIAKLRYVSITMLLDLIKAGYVSIGRRSEITQKKLAKIISLMANYDLITLTRFMTVNDDGSLNSGNYSSMRIITLGRNGSILLRELGKNTTRYNAFDIVQDGNTVKRFLCANQWLIYWLQTYKDEIGEEYKTSYVAYRKGPEFTGARIYATVTINGCPMVAEPVRRVEKFEIESNEKWLREKIGRFSDMFNNLDQLYHGKDEIHFPKKPILVLVCEDDDHIYEIWESIKSVLPDIKDQQIWFSSDLRIFNYNKKGERFLYFDNDVLHTVDLKEILGIDNESDSTMPISDTAS